MKSHPVIEIQKLKPITDAPPIFLVVIKYNEKILRSDLVKFPIIEDLSHPGHISGIVAKDFKPQPGSIV